MRNLRLGCALAAIVAIPTGALAQSTGSQELEEIVVTAAQRTQGIINVESVPKQRTTVGKAYIDAKAPGQSILDTLNLTPGLNFVNNDPYGNSGGNLRLRGLDGNRIALLQDGIPLNDSGNYAIYSNQQLDSELIERAVVNVGTTDVDSPTASSTGGTINYITIKPSKEFGGFIQGQYGENNYRRGVFLLNSGEIGPWRTSAFVSGSYTKYDKFKGPGSLEKKQLNARIYQPLGDNGDFISVIGNYNENRNAFYRNLRKSEFQSDRSIDRVDFCPRPTAQNGTVQNESLAAYQPCGGTTIGVDSGYYNLFINPSNTGNVRAQGRFTLADGLILTVDPSYQYVLANGGGNEIVSEKDQRLQGTRFNPLTPLALQPGVDLNGDGDVLDNIRLYRPNNTNTNRYGINTSLIYEFTEGQRVRVAYTRDDARHRQTGEFAVLDADGNPSNVFGGRNGTPILTLDGDVFQTRNRKSVATLDQYSGEYRGEFFDKLLTVSLGVRAPFFKRELNQFCNTTTAGFAYCSAQAQSTISNSNNARGLFKATVKYDKVLPNVGVSLQRGPHMLFGGYSENLSSPRTDDLYDVQIVNAQPETTKLFEVGYRYQSGPILGSIGGYTSKFENRIVRAFDQDLGINIARNVGAVRFKGFDGQIGYEVAKGVELYGTYSYTDTKLLNDLQFGRNGAGVATILPIKGNQLVETPKNQYGLRADYRGEIFSAGMEIKRVGDRFSTDLNDEVAPGYTVVNLNARYNLDKIGLRGSYFQLNWSNVFNEKYLGNISSQTNANPVIASNGTTVSANFPTYSVGAPSTIQGALRIAF